MRKHTKSIQKSPQKSLTLDTATVRKLGETPLAGIAGGDQANSDFTHCATKCNHSVCWCT